MDHIRVRLTIKLNGNQIVDLHSLRLTIETAIATSLPPALAVDTVKVTRINEAKPSTPEDDWPARIA